MDQMTVVGLATDCGNIIPKDLWAHRLVFKFSVFCHKKKITILISSQSYCGNYPQDPVGFPTGRYNLRGDDGGRRHRRDPGGGRL